MNKSIKLVSLLCSISLSLSILAGCGNNQTTESSSTASASTATTETSTETSKENVTLRFLWWGGDSRHKATLDAIAAYNVKNPNITIEGEYGGYDGYQQKLLTQLAGKVAPDLIQIDPIWNDQLGLQKDQFVDLSAEKNIDMTQFDEKIINSFCTTNGITIGLPMGINGFGLMINKTFMEKFNVPVDTEWTWEKIIEEGKKIHDKDKEAYLTALDTSMLQVIFLSDYLRGKTGNYWINNDYTIVATKEELTDAFKTMKALFDSGAVIPLGEAALYNTKLEQNPRYINGNIGMVEAWSGTLAVNKGVIKPENFAVGKAITVKDGKNTSTTYKPSMLLAVSKNDNSEEAVKFANWFMNDSESALILKDQRSIPASKLARKALDDAKVLDSDIVKMVEDTLKNPAEPVPQILNNSELVDITKNVSEKVAYGKITPEQGSDELIKLVTEKLSALKTKK